ncbi:MAG: class II fumarate hydratase [Treponema sp.]|nr:class II fumarate hydratase [Treponema sp.]
MAQQFRTEHDSLGTVRVPSDAYWGAQTERSRSHFRIGVGHEPMPTEIVRAFGILKKAAARANRALLPQVMTEEKCAAICSVCDDIISGALDAQFPLVVWQTGSGTHTNMNANEVIAHCANERAGTGLIHPNDDVNMSQSSNDTFPTAVHIASVMAVRERLFPAIDALTTVFKEQEERHAGIVKTGRTHLQDAVPVQFSQEISGWRASLEQSKALLERTLPFVEELALGGTAVGTGLNAPAGFALRAAEEVAALTGMPFTSAGNKFHALTSRDELVVAHGAVKALACDLFKIANDVRWLASGPRCGLGEISIPENEPGSSIMPGKVNPTQCEAVTMVAVQVMGNDAAIGYAASQGNFELNVFAPVIAYNFLQSVRLLADSIVSFTRHCAVGICANETVMRDNLYRSLMLVTALNPHIGYEKAAQVAHKAYAEHCSLKDACVSLGFLTAEAFDAAVNPEMMAAPHAEH